MAECQFQINQLKQALSKKTSERERKRSYSQAFLTNKFEWYLECEKPNLITMEVLITKILQHREKGEAIFGAKVTAFLPSKHANYMAVSHIIFKFLILELHKKDENTFNKAYFDNLYAEKNDKIEEFLDQIELEKGEEFLSLLPKVIYKNRTKYFPNMDQKSTGIITRKRNKILEDLGLGLGLGLYNKSNPLSLDHKKRCPTP